MREVEPELLGLVHHLRNGGETLLVVECPICERGLDALRHGEVSGS
jgi:hypothetical protein